MANNDPAMPPESLTCACPVLGFIAFSGTGKTTLLTRLIPLLKTRDLKAGLIKHAHHRFDIDKPGKDSYELRKAGADQVLVASRHRWALVTETPDNHADPRLQNLLDKLDTSHLDIVLVEGFKHVPFPRIELHRPSLGHPLLFPDDPTIIAVASDAPLAIDCPLPLLDINAAEQVADFVEAWYRQQR